VRDGEDTAPERGEFVLTLSFRVVVDDSILGLGLGLGDADKRRYLLGLANDFEDGKWRQEKFEDFIWDNVAETALSKRDRDALVGSPGSLLRKAARNLRLVDSPGDPGRGSELAEIVLYGVLKHKYGALPVVPKIFYKQNSQDNAKGADSVHIRREGADGFSLWFGETKFYNSIEDVRLATVVESVAAALDSGKLRKENSIITSVSDIDLLDLPVDLRHRIRDALSNRDSLDDLKPLIRVPILLIHECQITARATELNQAYLDEVSAFHKDRAKSYFEKQATKLAASVFKCDEIEFHLILFPVPSKGPLVTSFLDTAKFHKK
jgi:hypothetical protein